MSGNMRIWTRLGEGVSPSDFFTRAISVDRNLGRGSFASVDLVTSVPIGRQFAMKCRRDDLSVDKMTNADLLNEKEFYILKNLDHPFVIKLVAFAVNAVTGEARGFMEYASKGPLSNHITKNKGMRRSDYMRAFNGILLGLGYLHSRGLAHRDLKPDNCLLDHNGNIKLCDMNISSYFVTGKGGVSTERHLREPRGSRQYMAPEVLLNVDQQWCFRGPPGDIWSCGMILLEMVTGAVPWREALLEREPGFRNWTFENQRVYLRKNRVHHRFSNASLWLDPDTIWCKLEPALYSFLHRILAVSHNQRFQEVGHIIRDLWMVDMTNRQVVTMRYLEDSHTPNELFIDACGANCAMTNRRKITSTRSTEKITRSRVIINRTRKRLSSEGDTTHKIFSRLVVGETKHLVEQILEREGLYSETNRIDYWTVTIPQRKKTPDVVLRVRFSENDSGVGEWLTLVEITKISGKDSDFIDEATHFSELWHALWNGVPVERRHRRINAPLTRSEVFKMMNSI